MCLVLGHSKMFFLKNHFEDRIPFSLQNSFQNCTLVTNRTFSLAELVSRTSVVRFSPNDRTFFCRTQNFFFVLHPTSTVSFHILILLDDPHVCCFIIGLQVKQPKECQQSQNWNKTIINLNSFVCQFVRSTVQVQVFMCLLHVRLCLVSVQETKL